LSKERDLITILLYMYLVNFDHIHSLCSFFLFYLSPFIISVLHLLTCVYIVCATSPLSNSRQNLFCPLLLWLCCRENIRDKKDILFLLVWGKDSYTERFLALLPRTCVLQPTLVHLYRTSSILPTPLPMVASVNLRLLYSLFNREHINHIQVLSFLSFPDFSCGCSPLSVWPMPNNITAFVLGL
jgi:hypothetical protein